MMQNEAMRDLYNVMYACGMQCNEECWYTNVGRGDVQPVGSIERNIIKAKVVHQYKDNIGSFRLLSTSWEGFFRRPHDLFVLCHWADLDSHQQARQVQPHAVLTTYLNGDSDEYQEQSKDVSLSHGFFCCVMR